MKLHRTLFTAWVFAAGVALHAQNAHNMVVQTNKLGAEIQPTMYGLFFLRTLIMGRTEACMPN